MSRRTRAVVEVTAVAALVFGVVLAADTPGPVASEASRFDRAGDGRVERVIHPAIRLVRRVTP